MPYEWPKPKMLSIGDLTDLLIAWGEGEVSEGRLVELTGLDRTQLRDLKLTAIDRALILCKRTPEEIYREMEQIRNLRRERSSASPANSDPANTTEGPG